MHCVHRVFIILTLILPGVNAVCRTAWLLDIHRHVILRAVYNLS